jgi:hypothetical protein
MQPPSWRLARWLYTPAWLSVEQPSMRFDLATAWLVEHQVLPPGVSILASLITRVRERANARLYRKLAGLRLRDIGIIVLDRGKPDHILREEIFFAHAARSDRARG